MKRYRLTDICGSVQETTEYGDRDSLLAALREATALDRRDGRPHTYTVEEFEDPLDVPELVPDYETACDYLEGCSDVQGDFIDDNDIRQNAFVELLTICKAWNRADRFSPDWGNPHQRKCRPVFFHDFLRGLSCDTAGETLRPGLFVFSTAMRAKQFGEKFIDLFKRLYGVKEKKSFTNR